MDSKEIIQNVLNNVDEIKDDLSSDKYLEISNNLNSLYKELENKFYEIRYVTQRYTKSGLNHYTAIPVVKKEIIKLTEEEYRELENKLNENDNFLSPCCNMILTGIKERLSNSYREGTELVGLFESNNLDDEDSVIDISDKLFELTIHPGIAIVSCRKL